MATSEGPAGRSTATRPETRCLAAATKRFPGPTIFATLATETSPATPWAPPARRTESTPRSATAQRSSGLSAHARGGVATTMRATPATRAGTTPMRSDDG